MREPEDVFDPALYDDVRRPLGTATTLPFWCYTSPRWFEREMAEVFRPAWHFVGLASTLTRRGSYLTTSVLGEPVIIVRTDEGLRAYRNSCRHRGSILLEDRTGRCGGFRCRYHTGSTVSTAACVGRREPRRLSDSTQRSTR